MNPKKYLLDTLLKPDSEVTIEDVAGYLKEGAVCIYPTETIYGIGGRFDNGMVYNKILSVKGRSPDHPMILLGGSIDAFSMMDLNFPEKALLCAKCFWPGLLTIVLPCNNSDKTVGIRVSDHPFLVALSNYCSVPLYSTSANKTGITYNPDPDILFSTIGKEVDFIIDAGLLPPSKPSTVIKVTRDNYVTVLREGCITADEIFRVVKR